MAPAGRPSRTSSRRPPAAGPPPPPAAAPTTPTDFSYNPYEIDQSGLLDPSLQNLDMSLVGQPTVGGGIDGGNDNLLPASDPEALQALSVALQMQFHEANSSQSTGADLARHPTKNAVKDVKATTVRQGADVPRLRGGASNAKSGGNSTSSLANLSDLATAALSQSIYQAAKDEEEEEEDDNDDSKEDGSGGGGGNNMDGLMGLAAAAASGGSGASASNESLSPELRTSTPRGVGGGAASKRGAAGGSSTPGGGGGGGGGSSAASKRREANRLAAARFRTRKKDQVVELENRVHGLEAENAALKREVRRLRERMPDGGAGVPAATTTVPLMSSTTGSHRGRGGRRSSSAMMEQDDDEEDDEEGGDEREGSMAASNAAGAAAAAAPSPLSTSLIAAAAAAHGALDSPGGEFSMSDLENMVAAAPSPPVNTNPGGGKKKRKVAGTTAAGTSDTASSRAAAAAAEEANRQLMERVRNYEATLQAMNQEMEQLRRQGQMAAIDPALTGGDDDQMSSNTPRVGGNAKLGGGGAMSAQTYPLPFGTTESGSPGPAGNHHTSGVAGMSGHHMSIIGSPTPAHAYPAHLAQTLPHRQPTPVSSARGTPTASPRPSSPLTLATSNVAGRVGSFGLVREGSWSGNARADTPGAGGGPTSASGSKPGWNFARGLDSPVSAERSGIPGDDEEDDGDYFARRPSVGGGGYSSSEERGGRSSPALRDHTGAHIRQARTFVDLSNTGDAGSDSSGQARSGGGRPKREREEDDDLMGEET